MKQRLIYVALGVAIGYLASDTLTKKLAPLFAVAYNKGYGSDILPTKNS